jgi:hypothetical protein
MNFVRRTFYPLVVAARDRRLGDFAADTRLRGSPSAEIDSTKLASAGFAAVLAGGGVIVLMFGIAGVRGNSAVTGTYIVASLAVVGCFALRNRIVLSFYDVFYLGFLASVIASCSRIEGALDLKEACLLAASLAAYPIGRCLSPSHVAAIRNACFWLCGAIVLTGALATANVLLTLKDGSRPSVLGIDSAVTLLSMSFGYFVISFMCMDRNKSRDAFALALISFSNFVFAAAMVRFTLIATLIVVFVAMTASICRKDRILALLFAVLVLSSCAGLASRPLGTAHFVGKVIEENLVVPISAFSLGKSGRSVVGPETMPGECLANVAGQDSVTIRKALLVDGLSFLPKTGILGLGLDGYSIAGCVKGYPPHNDFIQATIEFGWLGGIGFALLALWPLTSLFALSWRDRDATFVFSLCLFLVSLSCVYGRISREVPLFLVLGLAVGFLGNLRDATRAIAISSARDEFAPRMPAALAPAIHRPFGGLGWRRSAKA